MSTEITKEIVRELLHYNRETGDLAWKPRARKWFESDRDCKRWNNRHAGASAFTYINGNRRWGCIVGQNHLAHRIAWLHAYGQWPGHVRFLNQDARDIRLHNMVDRKPRTVEVKRERLAA
jgi:HNH endonuclease